MALSAGDLVLCAGTLAQAPFKQRVEAAAAAGFAGISLFAHDVEAARAEGASDAELRAWLDDHGLAVAELDPLMNWIPGTGPPASLNDFGKQLFQTREKDLYAIAAALGARSVNAVCVADPTPLIDELAEAFAALCDRAGDEGLLVHLEFLPWSGVPNLSRALEVTERAGRANGGVMLDSWHQFRSGESLEVLRQAPGKRILAVQLNDAPAEPEPDPIEETLHRRLLPGEGAAPLPELLQILAEIDSPAPLGVEVFSDELAARPAREVAALAAKATRRLLEPR